MLRSVVVAAVLSLTSQAAAAGRVRVRATLRKLGGRLHEGYGVLLGGRALGTDGARNAHVMIRGDGGPLVRNRDGRATTMVRDWTRSDAIRRDDARRAGRRTCSRCR